MLISNRATNILLVAILAVGIALVAMLASGARGGPLDPPAAPASTDRVREPGTPISSVPFTIATSGSYYLTRNLTTVGSGAPGIDISASNVTLDLRGFTLESPDGTGQGIRSTGGYHSVVVEHGHVRRFLTAILLTDDSYVHDIEVRDFLGTGIELGTSSLVDDCTVHGSYITGGGPGLVGISLGVRSVARNCVVTDMNNDGVLLSAFSALESSQVLGNGNVAGKYGVRVQGVSTTIRDSLLDNGARDIGVASTGGTIIDNVIHCPEAIVTLAGAGTFTRRRTVSSIRISRGSRPGSASAGRRIGLPPVDPIAPPFGILRQRPIRAFRLAGVAQW